jgi:hypothetical protein
MDEFQRAAQASTGGLASEVFYFLRHSKKWWLLPIILVLFVFGGLMFLSGTAAAPFIYTLF